MHRFVWDLRYPPPGVLNTQYPISATPNNTPREPRAVGRARHVQRPPHREWPDAPSRSPSAWTRASRRRPQRSPGSSHCRRASTTTSTAHVACSTSSARFARTCATSVHARRVTPVRQSIRWIVPLPLSREAEAGSVVAAAVAAARRAHRNDRQPRATVRRAAGCRRAADDAAHRGRPGSAERGAANTREVGPPPRPGSRQIRLPAPSSRPAEVTESVRWCANRSRTSDFP
jgi:hypothetical protein